ncbi:MAG TPA: hypothetical protein DEA08_37410 [Planctomycetes bacterium]|nr:hypothetical protein [Planctomycetota bacterium]
MSTLFAVPAEQRERVRLAIVELSQADEKVQVRTVQRRAKVATRFVTVLLRALRAGYLSLDLPWDGSTAPLDLEGAIRSASNHRDRTRIHQEVAARVAAGSLSPTVAKTIQDSLSAARLSAKAAQDLGGSASVNEPILLLDRSTYLLAKVINRVVSPEILEEIVAFVTEAGERDLREFPNETIQDAARLSEGASS